MASVATFWQHADSLNITAEAEQRAIRYAQWSMAAESAILDNSTDTARSKYQGRGMMPVLKERSMADKSSDLKVEHYIWKLPLESA